jgi:hypothetical protein
MLAVWFQEWDNAIHLYNMEPNDTYNYDESGMHIGIGKKEKVITAVAKHTRLTAAKDTNCKSATIVEVISGDGNHGPSLIILAGKTIQKYWITQTDVPGNYMFVAMDTAFINDQLMPAWIIKFEE